MVELLIGLGCCLAMAGGLFGYLQITKKKYYDGHDQSSLSNTFYHTGWKFRVLLITMCVLLVYPILLANGMYTSGGWMYYAPYALLSWGKVAFAIAMGGLISVALNAYGNYDNENRPHVISASVLAAGGAMAGCLMRKEWHVGLAIWLAWLVYYLVKNHKNNKAGNPNAWGLYIELVAFYGLATSLSAFILINYFL
jgi:hypothetical protein